MRLINKSAIALAALAALMLTGCTSINTAKAFDASALKCDTVTAELTDAQAELKVAKADLKDAKGTAKEAGAKVEKEAASVKTEAITTRSGECERAALEITGVQEADGSLRQLPIYFGNDQPVIFDSTTNAVTPALLDGSLKYQNQTHSWADLVKRVGIQQGYIDGVNARSAFTGFNWSDVLKFAAVDKTDTDADVEARVIQVFNMPDISDVDVREQVRPYMGDFADTLQIMRINSSFVNTINVGTKQNLKMGDYVDRQKMIRVSLTPIIFDANGVPIQLDGSRGAGIFIDCSNLHWVPLQLFTCTESSCELPPPFTPPTVTSPPVTPPASDCTVGCNPPLPCVTTCDKVWEVSPPVPDGVVAQPSGPLEVRPTPVATPAPVIPAAEIPTSDNQAPGATVPDPVRTIPESGTGTTPDGGTGSVNPDPIPGSTAEPVNTTNPGNPFG